MVGTYGYGDDDADSDACSYSNSSLTVVVRSEETRVLESSIDCGGVSMELSLTIP
jgi:hypothetical protein